MKLTKSRNVSYLGLAAKVRTLQRTTRPLGELVDFTLWMEQATVENGSHKPGTVVARHIEGDGRTPDTFSEYAVATFAGLHAEERAADWAMDRLSGDRKNSPQSTAHAAVHRAESIARNEAWRVERAARGIDCTPPSGC